MTNSTWVNYDFERETKRIYRVVGPNGNRLAETDDLVDAQEIRALAVIDAKRLGYDVPETAFVIMERDRITKIWANDWSEVGNE